MNSYQPSDTTVRALGRDFAGAANQLGRTCPRCAPGYHAAMARYLDSLLQQYAGWTERRQACFVRAAQRFWLDTDPARHLARPVTV